MEAFDKKEKAAIITVTDDGCRIIYHIESEAHQEFKAEYQAAWGAGKKKIMETWQERYDREFKEYRKKVRPHRYWKGFVKVTLLALWQVAKIEEIPHLCLRS